MEILKYFRALLNIIIFFIFLSCTFGAVINFEEKTGEMVCIPNATFHIDCNRCKCSSSGMAIDCTDWTCATLKIPHDLLLNLTLSCRPGEIFLYNAYKCVCSSRGDRATCSSAVLELAHLLRPANGPVISSEETIDQCTPGILFRSGCDSCVCPETGKRAACLALGCLHHNNHRVDSAEKICFPYSTFSLDCNQCVCSGDGLSLSCDRYPCLGVEMRDDQMLNITFLCEPDGQFLYNQYECVCSSRGSNALCSLARRDKSIEYRMANNKIFSIAEFPELCTPGMLFKDRCNVCICGKDESAACTAIDCDSIWKYRSTNDTHEIVPLKKIWTQRIRNKRFCKRNNASMYCRYLRSF